MTKRQFDDLNGLLNYLKTEACLAGRLPSWRPEDYDNRHKMRKPFRCIRYNRLVRQIGSLQRLLDDLSRPVRYDR